MDSPPDRRTHLLQSNSSASFTRNDEWAPDALVRLACRMAFWRSLLPHLLLLGSKTAVGLFQSSVSFPPWGIPQYFPDLPDSLKEARSYIFTASCHISALLLSAKVLRTGLHIFTKICPASLALQISSYPSLELRCTMMTGYPHLAILSRRPIASASARASLVSDNPPHFSWNLCSLALIKPLCPDDAMVLAVHACDPAQFLKP